MFVLIVILDSEASEMGSAHPPSSPKKLLFSSPSFYTEQRVIQRNKLIPGEDGWRTIDVSVPSRQRHFLQLCREYKHDHGQQWRDYRRHKGGRKEEVKETSDAEEKQRRTSEEEKESVTVCGEKMKAVILQLTESMS